MRHFIFVTILIFSGVVTTIASAAPEECPDLSGQYACKIVSEAVAPDSFALNVDFLSGSAPTYSFRYVTDGVPSQTIVVDEKSHDGISQGVTYKAMCSENKLIAKYYVSQRAVDVRVYTKGKDGFMVDTLAGDREICKIALP